MALHSTAPTGMIVPKATYTMQARNSRTQAQNFTNIAKGKHVDSKMQRLLNTRNKQRESQQKTDNGDADSHSNALNGIQTDKIHLTQIEGNRS